LHDCLARERRELGAELTAPGAIFKSLVAPRGSLNRRNVVPLFVVAGAISAVHCIQHRKLRGPPNGQGLPPVRHAIIRLRDGTNSAPDLSAFRNEVIVRINYEECGTLLLVGGGGHEISPILWHVGGVACLVDGPRARHASRSTK